MKYRYLVCLSTDSELLPGKIDHTTQFTLEKIYEPIVDEAFELNIFEGLKAINERKEFYDDLNSIVKCFLEAFKHQGFVNEDGTLYLENVSTSSVVRLVVDGIKKGVKAINDAADKSLAEIKEAKLMLKKGKNQLGEFLSLEEKHSLQAIADKTPFKIPATISMPLSLVLAGLSTVFEHDGKELKIDLEQIQQDLDPCSDLLQKWMVKAAVNSPEITTFLKSSNIITSDDELEQL